MALYIGFFSRNSHSQMFFKIGVLKHFVIFTGKKLCWRRGLACNFIGKRFTTGPLLRILRNFSEQLFQKSPYGVSFCFFFSYLLFEFSPVKMQEKESSLERKHKIICFLFPSNFFTVRTLWEREGHTHYFEKRAMGLKIRFFESAIFRHHSLWKYVFVTQLLYFFNRSFVYSANKIKEHMFGYTFSLYKYYQTTLNSKQRTEKLKTKIPRYRNTKSQNTERKKL